MNFLEELKKLNLSKGEFAIFGSACLAIRDIRENPDLDVAVTQKLFDELSKKYDSKNGLITVGNVELFSNWDDYDVHPWIEDAEIIEGIPFVKLKYYLEFKKKRRQPKDLKDIELIEKYLKK